MPPNQQSAVLTVPSSDLTKLFTAVSASIPMKGPNANTADFMAEAMRKVNPRGASDMALVLRSTALAQILLEDLQAVEKAQLVVQSAVEPEAFVVTASLAHACSVSKITVDMDEAKLRIGYELPELIQMGREHLLQGPKATLEVEGLRPMEVNATLAHGLLPKSSEGTLGDRLRQLNASGTRAKIPKMTRDDYPNYFDAMSRRAERLSGMAPDAAAQFTVVPKTNSEPAGVLLLNGIAPVPEPVRKTLMKMGGLGPWSLYHMLDEGRQWSWEKYRDAVLSDPSNTRIPCQHGCYPITYFLRHGDANDLARLLSVNERAIAYPELSHRPLLFDLVQRHGTDEKIRMCLEAGAAPNDCDLTGLSVMVVAMRASNHYAVLALFIAGYDPEEDIFIDKVTISRYLSQKGIPDQTRAYVEEIREDVPNLSERHSYLQKMETSLSKLMPRGGH